jgi:hypothetical protein
VELLNQRMTRHEYSSALVGAMAVLGVSEDGWKDPETYPPILSSIIKIARFMIIQKALEMSGEEEDISPYDFDSGYESEEQRGCLTFVTEMVDRFMIRGSQSPMQWMLDLRTYGEKVHYNTTSAGHVEWNEPDELLYKELKFTVPQFRGMVHGVVGECRRLLGELMFCPDAMPEVPWESIRDDPSNATPGWNFLQDTRTQLPIDGTTWLFDRIGGDARIRRRFIRTGSESGYDRAGIEAYMRQVVRWLEKLAVAVQWT